MMSGGRVPKVYSYFLAIAFSSDGSELLPSGAGIQNALLNGDGMESKSGCFENSMMMPPKKLKADNAMKGTV